MSSNARASRNAKLLFTSFLAVALTFSVMFLAPKEADATYGHHHRVVICKERADGRLVPRYVSPWQAYWHGQQGGQFPQPFFLDLDGDSYTASPTWARLRCSPNRWWVPRSAEADCNDWKAWINPGQVEIPGNGYDDDCDSTTSDAINSAPVIDPISDQVNTEGDSLNLPIVASDPDGDAIGYSVAGLPPGASFDTSTNTITGTATAAGTYSVTVTVTDGSLTSTEAFTWTVDPAAVNQAPVVSPIADQTNTVGDTLSVSVFAADPDGDAISVTVTGLPPGASFNQSTQTIEGTATSPGTYQVTVTANDGLSTGTETFTWIVNSPPVNQAPIIDPIADQTNNVGDALSVQITAVDPNFDAVSYNVTGLPPGASFNPFGTTIEGTATTAGTYSVSVEVSDGLLTTTETFTWTIS